MKNSGHAAHKSTPVDGLLLPQARVQRPLLLVADAPELCYGVVGVAAHQGLDDLRVLPPYSGEHEVDSQVTTHVSVASAPLCNAGACARAGEGACDYSYEKLASFVLVSSDKALRRAMSTLGVIVLKRILRNSLRNSGTHSGMLQ